MSTYTRKDLPEAKRPFRFRPVVRLSSVVVAVMLSSQVLPFAVQEYAHVTSDSSPGAWFSVRGASLLLPALSPFLALCSMAARRSLTWVGLLALPVIIVAAARGRWFCRWLCPTGIVSDYAGMFATMGKRRPRRLRYVEWPKIGPWVIALGLGAAVAGYPLFLWIDPLSIFSGCVSSLARSSSRNAFFLCSGMILIVGLSIWRPNLWCQRMCPLGYMQELTRIAACYLRRGDAAAARSDGSIPNHNRRAFLGLAVGGVLGIVFRGTAGPPYILRPPGAVREDKFTGLCARCGNCVRACPEKILSSDLGTTGVSGMLTPVARIGPGYCLEFCNECTKVCPTGAIQQMSLVDKQNVAMGCARVIKKKCLAWAKGAACPICEEYCLYHAITLVDQDGVGCPVVDEDVCRGCGLCQLVCPADDVAIVISGTEQRRLSPVDLSRRALV